MRWRTVILAVVAPGCGGGDKGTLVLNPPSVDWGEVDFQVEMPEGGYSPSPTDISLVNDGAAPLDITIPGYDRTHLCLLGFETMEGPLELENLQPGAYYTLTVGVCGYDMEAGELGSLIRGEIQFVNTGSDPLITLPYSFTPIRNIPDGDTSD